ncbi:MarR family transcriptional regulator [Glycomyces buryatensis]|uniref:MarR family transcriptional regulator n=2 Tax=Glycomyces buryatensis TaxID=2570927 RepID=A0A4S8Q7L4_9ACTN|nr:MarR family transcriptional regulator [Glycomyces buryatensis]
MGLPTALVRTRFLVDAAYADAVRDYGITSQQAQLMCLVIAGPRGMCDLAGVLGLAKSSLTGLVDRTAKRGLVHRVPDPSDGRAQLVALTEEGADVAERMHASTVQHVDNLAYGLSESERELLASLLSRVITDNEVPKVFGEGDRAQASA